MAAQVYRLLIIFLAFFTINCDSEPSQQISEPRKEQAAEPDSGKKDSIISYLTGKFEPHQDERFDTIAKMYADREGLLLRKEAYESFKRMYEQADSAGISLTIRSATRNFEYQKGIWERKWKGVTEVEGEKLPQTTSDPYQRAKKILRYSSMPGTSRHHWGTEIDLNAFENDYFEQGEGKAIYEWLTENAGSFGYCQVYTEKGAHRPKGYEEEKWHWSYLPIARPLTDLAEKHLEDDDISGFEGAQTADSLNVVQHYVLGIDPSCR